MQKIKMDIEGEYIYYEKLDNGLDVYLYSRNDINDNYVTFSTKFGSIYNEFVPLNEKKILKVPNGVAHFLEHKMFAQRKDPQPEEFFSLSGANSNAYTTFKNTTYLFSGPEKVQENVNYLLDFVQDLYLTEKNVASEKGIIIQEINMCNDRPDTVLYDKIRTNTIHNNKFKESIIGTEEEVNSITKELLEKCYHTFYHPSNMFLIVTGNFDVKEMFELIKENQNNKKFILPKDIMIPEVIEKDSIVKEKEIIKINTNIPKVAYNIKIPINKYKIDKRKINLYTFIIFSLLFDDTSIIDEELKKDKIITSTLSLNTLNIDSHIIVSLINQTFKYEELIRRIDKYLENIIITETDLERKKKLLISNEIFTYDSIYSVNEMIINEIIFDNKIENNSIEIIKSLNYKELLLFLKGMNNKNKSIVILKNDN